MKPWFAVLLLPCLAATPAAAATVTTQQFIAAVQPLARYLAESSRLAGQSAAGARVRAFARAESESAAAMDAAIAEWLQADARQAAEDAAAPTIDGLGPLANAVNVTVDAAAATNRTFLSPLAPLASKGDLEAFGQRDLGHLSALAGPDFDAFYLASDTAALRHLVEELKSYISNGDDTTLRRFAVRNLPRAESRLAAIGRL